MTAGTGSSGTGLSGSTAGIGSPGMTAGTGSPGIRSFGSPAGTASSGKAVGTESPGTTAGSESIGTTAGTGSSGTGLWINSGHRVTRLDQFIMLGRTASSGKALGIESTGLSRIVRLKIRHHAG
ncbi:unnamed protein product [Staurois parvus]|uniref:Uncharacterized protein n=1 Tax=Staurois parvus TaxID=386267 RepID=A0ABN9G6L5_9NEOB|nr:unnamed protein product [Staurois parvus]